MTDAPHVTVHTDKTSLIIPVDREHLGGFIGALLGRPQTIEDSLDGPFDLDKSNLEDVFHLVHQRVKQQNRAELVQFTVTIHYADDSSVLINNLQDFQYYREVRPQVSVAAELMWIYLIQFEDKPIPERQVIELRISTARATHILHDPAFLLVRRRLRDLYQSFTLRIEHTARSWGVDIEHLLLGQIRSWIKKEHWLKRSIYINAGWLGLTAGVLFLSLVWLGIYMALQPKRDAFLVGVKAVLSKSIEEKLDFIVASLADNPFIQHNDISIATILIVAIGLSFFIGGMVTIFADNPPQSYLVLSDAAKEHREVSMAKRKRNWKYLVASGVIATIAGVLSRYLFLKLFGQVGP